MSNSDENLYVWPDGHYCTESELSGYSHRSDDYEVIRPGSGVYQLIIDYEATCYSLQAQVSKLKTAVALCQLAR